MHMFYLPLCFPAAHGFRVDGVQSQLVDEMMITTKSDDFHEIFLESSDQEFYSGKIEKYAEIPVNHRGSVSDIKIEWNRPRLPVAHLGAYRTALRDPRNPTNSNYLPLLL